MAHIVDITPVDENKHLGRSLGVIQNIMKFCTKYDLSFNPHEEPINLILGSLETMVLRNEFKRVGPHDDMDPYVRMKVYVDNKKALCGYFKTSEISDITKLDPRVTLK